MNKQIEQFARQAGFNLIKAHNGQILPNSLERFAKNIIAECARIADSKDSPHPYASFGDMIRSQFDI